MCGIAGYVGEFIAGLGVRFNIAQAHRGPDGSGVFEDSEAEITLAHVRLAILDTSPAAAQPMKTADGRFVLIYNGEIYNFQELRKQLASEGARFTSTGDTEVLLHGLALHGEAFLERLNGMYAFAFWDTRERTLLLARDPIGVKPLYIAEPKPGTLLFASEIKAMASCPALIRRPNFPSILEHMVFGFASGNETAFEGIHRLGPGQTLRWRDGKFSTRRFWTPEYGTLQSTDRREACAQLRSLLIESSQRQMVSDVPVGSFLSGGLDSSLLTAAATSQPVRFPFRSFTIRWPENLLDGRNDDAAFARTVARDLGIQHNEILIQSDIVKDLPRVIYHLDEPLVDPGAIVSMLICQESRRQGTPVLLSGQGADELFGGYMRYRAMGLTSWTGRLPGPMRTMMARAANRLPMTKHGPLGVLLRRMRRVFGTIDQDPDSRFLLMASSTPLHAARAVLRNEHRSELRTLPGKAGLHGIERWLDRDLTVYLPNHNLLYTDKTSMAAGVETRVPLLDQKLVETATRYPASWKLDGARTKAIFRDAAKGLVPDSVINRPKVGFGMPYRNWLRHDLEPLWNDVTSPSVVKKRGWFDPAALQSIRRESQSGREDLYMLQWAVLTVELWAREFLDRNPSVK